MAEEAKQTAEEQESTPEKVETTAEAGKTFTQADVDKIIAERLQRERAFFNPRSSLGGVLGDGEFSDNITPTCVGKTCHGAL